MLWIFCASNGAVNRVAKWWGLKFCLTAKAHIKVFFPWITIFFCLLYFQAVEESLKSVNLFYGGVGDKQAGKYSGGMKRRLSVAIALIGDPKVYIFDTSFKSLKLTIISLWKSDWITCHLMKCFVRLSIWMNQVLG